MIEHQVTIFMCSYCMRVYNTTNECQEHEVEVHSVTLNAGDRVAVDGGAVDGGEVREELGAIEGGDGLEQSRDHETTADDGTEDDIEILEPDVAHDNEVADDAEKSKSTPEANDDTVTLEENDSVDLGATQSISIDDQSSTSHTDGRPSETVEKHADFEVALVRASITELLQQHQPEPTPKRVSIENPYRVFCCTTCFEVFPSRAKLSIHSREHRLPSAAEKKVTATSSNKVARQSKTTETKISTVRTKRGGRSRRRNVDDVARRTDRPLCFLCPTCKKGFGSQFHLSRHSFIHNAVKRFACEQCDYRSNDMRTVRAHMKREHRGIKS